MVENRNAYRIYKSRMIRGLGMEVDENEMRLVYHAIKKKVCTSVIAFIREYGRLTVN